MTEKELFDIIDNEIDIFKQNEGFKKRIKVSKNPKSDWLVFNWRQLTWKQNELNYLIEIFPNFDQNEIITSWTLYTAVFYEENKKSFYLKKTFSENVSLQHITDNLKKLIVSCFKYITSVEKNEIPIVPDID